MVNDYFFMQIYVNVYLMLMTSFRENHLLALQQRIHGRS